MTWGFTPRRQGDKENNILVGAQRVLVHGAVKASLQAIVTAQSLALGLRNRGDVHYWHATEELLRF